jgi:hypothetical protein
MPTPYSRLIGRRAVEVKINELETSGIPIYDKERGVWDIIDSSSLTSAGGGVSGSIITPSEVTSSFSGDGSNLTGVPTFLTIQGNTGTDVINVKTDTLLVTGSGAITATVINNTIQISADGVLTSSAQVDYNDLINVPHGIVSSSQQFDTLTDNFTGSFLANKVVIDSGNMGTVITGSSLTGLFDELRVVNLAIPSSQYSAAHMEYMAQRPNEIRAGVVMASWTDADVGYTDISHGDVGDTYDLSFDVVKVSTDIYLRAKSVGSGSGNWSMQIMYKLFPKLI